MGKLTLKCNEMQKAIQKIRGGGGWSVSKGGPKFLRGKAGWLLLAYILFQSIFRHLRWVSFKISSNHGEQFKYVFKGELD